MRALLNSVGIQSHAVAIYSGESRFVQPSWPSPQHFNHAIIAVRVSHAVKVPTVVEHAELGRLLFFDLTSEWLRAESAGQLGVGHRGGVR